MDPFSSSEIEWIRNSEFPVAENFVCLNHAVRSPLPASVAAAAVSYFEGRRDRGFLDGSSWFQAVETCRKNAARFIGAKPEDTAFISNTAEGINHVAQGLEFKPGERVLLSDVEYPSSVYPWMNLSRKGVEVHWIRVRERDGLVRPEDVYRALDSRVKVVCLSLVSFVTGQRIAFREIGAHCRERGIIFVADATQALGQVRVDVAADFVDALVVEGRKWLLAPEGAGFWYCSPRLLERLTVAYPGAAGVRNRDQYLDYQLEFRKGAARFERGALNVPGILGLNRALELFTDWGPERVEARVRSLAESLCLRLREHGMGPLDALSPMERSGIVRGRTKASGDDPSARLKQAGIQVVSKGDRYALSPHFYNVEAELDLVVDVLSGSWRGRAPQADRQVRERMC